MGKFLITYKDWGTPQETSTVTIPITDLTDTNIVAQTTLVDTLRTEIAKICIGGLKNRQLVAWENDTQTEPSSALAQREVKWVVKYHEVGTLEPHRMELPCANLLKLDPNASDKILMTDADVLTFIAAFEAVVEVNGNACEVDEILFLTVRS